MSSTSKNRISALSSTDDRPYVPPTVLDRVRKYPEPVLLYLMAFFFFLKVLVRTLFTDPFAIFPLSELGERSFGEAWLAWGGSDMSLRPLNSLLPVLGASKGALLDVGPGTGLGFKFYTNPGIKLVCAVEPSEVLQPGLQRTAEKVGLGDKFQLLPCGVERERLYPALNELGIWKGGPIFDHIVCFRVLCSVPDPVDAVAVLYDLLKPGGRFIVCEHVKNPWTTPRGSLVARLIQILLTLLGWNLFLGGCNLGRDTGETLRAAADRDGGWAKVDLEILEPWGTFPYVKGQLVKRS